MHSTSLHVGYPRSPFKFLAFINALLFLCHTSGLKLFPGGSVLLRPSSNAGLHSMYLLQPSPMLDCFRAPTPKCIRAPTPDCVQAPTPDYIQDVIDHLGPKKLKEFSRA